MKATILIAALFLSAFTCLAQTPIDVVENTLKVSAWGEEVFYYGFAEGDQVIFNFNEMKGRDLKEIEIIEWPSTSKFMEYKTSKIQNKIFSIPRTGTYKFRFKNSSISGRVCKFKIQRVPANQSTKNFNTNVYWHTLYDTSIVPTQERFLIKSDTTVQTIVDQFAKVPPKNTINGITNKAIVDFTLPETTVSWSYYIGTGYEGRNEYLNAREKFINTSVAAVAKIPTYGPIGALALDGTNYFTKAPGLENVKYSFIRDLANVQAFQADRIFYNYKQGDVVNDAAQMKTPANGKIYIGLLNDNPTSPIDVMVKISAVVLNQQWDTRTVNKTIINPRTEPYLK
jgi:hypothetical protein